MAIIREPMKCHICGTPIEEEIHIDQIGTPSHLQIIGDTFIKWKEIECDCVKKLNKTPVKQLTFIDGNRTLNLMAYIEWLNKKPMVKITCINIELEDDNYFEMYSKFYLDIEKIDKMIEKLNECREFLK